MGALFSHEGMKIDQDSLFKSLSALPLQGKDLYVAMDLAAIGSISSEVKGRDYLAAALIEVFHQVIGADRSLVMPAFTFSWGASGSGVFSKRTRTHLGVLPNYLIEQEGVYRSNDPMFSCVVQGGSQFDYHSTYRDSFGEESLFQIHHRKQNGSIMNFGTRLFNPSYIHYVEQYVDEHIERLGYRAKVEFEGLFEDETGSREHGLFYSFMRTAEQIYGYDYALLEREMRDLGRLELIRIGGATVQLTDASALFEHMVERMSGNPHYYLKGTM